MPGIPPLRFLFLVLLLAVPSTAAEISATRLDGTTVVGELKGLDETEAVLVTSDGEQRVSVEDLLSLRWPRSAADQDSASAKASQIELADGTVVPVDQVQVDGSKATVTIAGPLSGPGETLELSKRQLAAVRLHPLNDAIREQWQEIRELEPAADILVLLKRDGTSLDYVEGVLGDVSDSKVEFELDGEAVKIDRAKVAGFIYFRREAEKDTEPRLVVSSGTGLKANVARARLVGDTIELTTAADVTLKWPLDDLELADFSAGKLMYLSDLDPATENSEPIVALPTGATLAAKYGKPRRDHSAFGGPLMLAAADAATSASSAGTSSYQKGLAIRSRTEVIYRLPPGYRRLNAITGLDPATRASGNVRLEISGDDRPLFDEEVAGNDDPRKIDLDIAGVKRLKIIVDYGSNLDTGDWLNLCDLKIVK